MQKRRDIQANNSYSIYGKIFILVFIVAITAVILFGCSSIRTADNEAGSGNGDTLFSQMSVDEKVEHILNNMSDAEKVGQMLVIGVQGKDFNDDMAYMLHEYAVGGVILFDRNLQSREQVTELNGQLQKNAYGKLPLFIGIDEEGGNVARMREGLAPPLSQREIGAAGAAQQAFVWAASTAEELEAVPIGKNQHNTSRGRVWQCPRKHACAPGITKSYIHDYFRFKSLSALLSSVGMEPPCLPLPPSIQGFILETNSCQ